MLLRVEKPPARNNGADETFSSRRTFARNFTNLLRLVSRHGLYIKWKKGDWAIPRRRKEESRYPRHFSRYRSYGISIEFSIKVRYSINVQRLKNDISLHCKLEYGPAWVLNGARRRSISPDRRHPRGKSCSFRSITFRIHSSPRSKIKEVLIND